MKIYRNFTGIFLHVKYKHSEIFYKYDVDENLIKTSKDGKIIYKLKDIAVHKKIQKAQGKINKDLI